jgi:hypothetical protein
VDRHSADNNRRSGTHIHLAAKEHMRELSAFVVSVAPVFYDVVYVGYASS